MILLVVEPNVQSGEHSPNQYTLIVQHVKVLGLALVVLCGLFVGLTPQTMLVFLVKTRIV